MRKINNELLNRISAEARESQRRRKNFNFHSESDDPLQRMLNALEPDTYIQPHRHINPDKREAFLILRGAICLIEFDEWGKIVDHFVMKAGSGDEGAEITPGVYHSLISLEPGTIIYEIKDGPWDINTDKEFAPWAPNEGSSESLVYNQQILEKLVI